MVISTVQEDLKEDEWQIPVTMAEEDVGTDTESDMDAAPPVHPVPTMQGAFEESMDETMNEDEPEVPDRYSKADSVTRRKMLLEQTEYERTVAGRWKQKPGEKFHPLWKLVAQISFGMHLLQQGLAKSDEEVLKILQTHVDEVDGFLERTTEDFDLAQGDINERIRYLKLPLEHGQVFDQMLGNRDFRVAIVEGNEKIEHIIDRTAAAMNDALKDVQKGLDATRELAKYMTRVDKQWDDRTEEHDSVYLAMIGNTEGWTRAFLTLQSKGGHLRKALIELGSIVAEMQRRAGAASRKNLVPSRSVNGNRYQVATRAESPAYSATPPRSPMKPLPTAPESVARVASSQKYNKTSTSHSPQPSPYLRQQNMDHSPQPWGNESTLRVDSPNQWMPPRSPGTPRIVRLESPNLATKTSQTLRPVRSPEPPRSIDSPEPGDRKISSNSARSVRSPEPGRPIRTPEPLQLSRNPEPSKMNQVHNLSIPQEGPGLYRSIHSPSPRQQDYQINELEATEGRTQSSDPTTTFRTPAQIMALMNSQARPPIPERAPSRRKSLTEKTKELLRKKPSIARGLDEGTPSKSCLPIYNPSTDHTPGKQPTSPVQTTIVRRTSSRKANAMSMSTYSTSPTSPFKYPSETPPLREASPVHTRGGNPVPTQSSYGILSLQPVQPLSPLHNPAISLDPAKGNNTPHSPANAKIATQPVSIIKNKAHPDDSEGNVNTNHPLLQTARHARFTRISNGDLPLRHYHSQGTFAYSNPDLTHNRSDEKGPPKRSSSLLYNRNTRFMPSPEPNASQTSHNTSSTHFMSRSHTAPAESELGIHPAHRTPDPASATSAAPSPSLSNKSSAPGTGATPPPIATIRSPLSSQGTPRAKSPTLSPPTRFAPFPPSEPQKQPQVTTEAVIEHDWQPNHQSQQSNDSSNNPSNPTDKRTSTTNTMPLYLQPTSSTALIDFLASTPPPSPPHPGTRLDKPLSPAPHTSTGAFFNRSFITNPYPKDGESSPTPPAPGSRSLTHLGRVLSGEKEPEQVNKKGWKKMFGGGKSTKKINGAKPTNRSKKNKKGAMPELSLNGLVPPSNGVNGTHSDGGFVGMGKDGVWITRKNFLKT